MKLSPDNLARLRMWAYGVSVAVVGLLIGYERIAPDKAPLWLALISAVFLMTTGTTAAYNVYHQRKAGMFDGEPPNESGLP